MSEELLGQLDRLEAEGREAIRRADTPDDREEVRVRFLGRKGRLTGVLRQLGTISPELRPVVGARANEVKEALSELIDAASAKADDAGAEEPIDLSLPGRRPWQGGRHPVTLVVEEICEIFRELGFVRAAGPEAETTWYNFTALNIPLDHPAADMHDTFFLGKDVVLRTHTSPVQARVMETHEPPIRVVVPGMVYRRDPFDASHAPGFEQIEGLAVDEGITFVDFKATLAEFSRRFWGPDTQVRFRPSFFPFTEPSAEVDVECIFCAGEGCRVCSRTGWLEVLGAGMVDPNVFEASGIDADRYSGFAFGLGVERIAMLKRGIRDIRRFFENDVRFLEQF